MQVLLVGPSVRALASSARRAGLTPIAYDLFADLDLLAIATTKQIALEDYPHHLPALLQEHGADRPLIYSGGLENHPEVLSQLARQRPLWGYFPHTAGVRDPEMLDRLASPSTFRRLEHPTQVPTKGQWLLKPRAGSGGRGITHWRPGVPVSSSHFLEAYMNDAQSYSALYVASQEATQLLGITRQLVGEAWLHAPTPFTYVGSIGPLTMDEKLQQRLERIGNALVAADRELRGLFGIDFLHLDNEVYLLEVNPRYTASTEILELAYRQPLLQSHVEAFTGVSRTFHAPSCDRIIGKATYFAPQAMIMPTLPWKPSIDYSIPPWADITAPGAFIQKNEPVCTVFATGRDEAEVESQLRLQIAKVSAAASVPV